METQENNPAKLRQVNKPDKNKILERQQSRRTISVPIKYVSLIDKILDWLNNCDEKSSRYRTLKNLVSTKYNPQNQEYSINSQEILKPIVYFKNYPVTRLTIQTLIDYNEFIYSPTALVNLLNNLGGFKNINNRQVTYNQINQWNLNYHNRAKKLAEKSKHSVKMGKLIKSQEAIEFCKLHREKIYKWLEKILSKNYKTPDQNQVEFEPEQKIKLIS